MKSKKLNQALTKKPDTEKNTVSVDNLLDATAATAYSSILEEYRSMNYVPYESEIGMMTPTQYQQLFSRQFTEGQVTPFPSSGGGKSSQPSGGGGKASSRRTATPQPKADAAPAEPKADAAPQPKKESQAAVSPEGIDVTPDPRPTRTRGLGPQPASPNESGEPKLVEPVTPAIPPKISSTATPVTPSDEKEPSTKQPTAVPMEAETQVNPHTQASYTESGAGVLKEGENFGGTTFHQTGFQTVKDQLAWMAGKKVKGYANPDRLGYAAIIAPDGTIIETANPNQKTYHTRGDVVIGDKTEDINQRFSSIAHVGEFDPKRQGKKLLESGQLANFFFRRPGSFDRLFTHAEHLRDMAKRGNHDPEVTRNERLRYEKGKGEGAAFAKFVRENRDIIQKQINEFKRQEQEKRNNVNPIKPKMYGGELDIPMNIMRNNPMELADNTEYKVYEPEVSIEDFQQIIYDSVSAKVSGDLQEITNPQLPLTFESDIGSVGDYQSDSMYRYFCSRKFGVDDKDYYDIGIKYM